MSWDQRNTCVGEITDCVNSYNEKGTAETCAALITALKQSEAIFPAHEASRILTMLRGNRYFNLMVRMAEAFIRNGQDGAQVQRQYAQALLDMGQVSAAIPLLRQLVEDTGANTLECNEAKGLLGRAFKQRYVDAGHSRSRRARADLNSAIEWYSAVYQADATQYWHGINAVALLKRAQRDRIVIDSLTDPAGRAHEIAGRILRDIEDGFYNGFAGMWDCGTAAEACIALEQTPQASQWLQRYVSHPGANAFEIASTLRQFKEVWQLDNRVEPGLRLLTILQAALIKHEGGQLQVETGDMELAASKDRDRYLQKVLGSDSYTSYKELRTAFQHARCVARIQNYAGYGGGTGFLISGNDLHEALGDDLYVLTNAHVVSNDIRVCSPAPLLPHEARVTFQVLREEGIDTRDYEISALLWTSPPGELDASLLRLSAEVDNIQPFPIASRLPETERKEHVYIIGHPKGGTLSFSIQDNALLDHEGPIHGKPPLAHVVRLHYRAPTDVGSSGSPIFDRQWQLIGLHHAGASEMPKLNRQTGVHPANEGIWIQSIIAAMKRDPQQIGRL